MNLSIPLAKAAFLMVLFMVPGVIIRKFKLNDENIAHVISQLLVYIVQPALFVRSFLIAYSSRLMGDFLKVAAVVLSMLLISYFCSDFMFPRGLEKEKRKVLRFGTVFYNSGNMGIPLIIYTLGSSYVFFVQAALLVFNLLVFSLGRYLYSEDRKYLSVRDAVLNPGLLPSMLGLILYVTGVGGWIETNASGSGALGFALSLLISMLDGLTDMVAPLSMIVIGVRLADLDLKGIFADAWMYLVLGYRLLLIPAVTVLIMLALRRSGVISDEICAVIVILSSTPCAALTTVMAELYGCDSVYGSKLVSISTLVSVFTMPLIISLV